MKTFITLLLILSASCISSAQTAQRNPDSESINRTPTLEQVIEKYLQAVGGRAALEKIKSRASKGAFTSNGLKTKGPVELYAKAPNKQLMVLLAAGYGNYRRGFNGSAAWELYPGRSKANSMSGFPVRDAEFYLPIKFREVYLGIALKGTEELNGQKTYMLEAPVGGETKRLYFDAQTGLLLRSEARSAKGKALESFDYSDYREVDGVKEPFSIRMVDRDGTDFDIKLYEVRHNVELGDANFDKPAAASRGTASDLKTPKGAAQIRFTSGASAIIPFELDDDDNEVMKVSVNNSPPLNFTIDTGSDFFGIITSEQAKKLDLTPRNNYRVTGIVGDIETAAIPSANLSLPGLEASNQRLEVLFSDASNAESKIDGAFGYEFLKKFVVEIDYEAKTIKLTPAADYKYRGAGEIIPVKVRNGNPLARMKLITAGGKTIETYFKIDSGLGGTLVFFTPAVKKYGLPGEMRTVQAPVSVETGGDYNRQIGRAESFQLGRFTFPNVPVSLSENAEGHDRIEGNIGGEILHRFKVIYDFSHHRIILEPNSHFRDPFEEDMSGLSLLPYESAGEKVFRVRQAVAGTPASEAGIIEGDLITAIDDKPAREFTTGRLGRMFMQDGREYLLSVRRGERAIQVRLKLRRLI